MNRSKLITISLFCLSLSLPLSAGTRYTPYPSFLGGTLGIGLQSRENLLIAGEIFPLSWIWELQLETYHSLYPLLLIPALSLKAGTSLRLYPLNNSFLFLWAGAESALFTNPILNGNGLTGVDPASALQASLGMGVLVKFKNTTALEIKPCFTYQILTSLKNIRYPVHYVNANLNIAFKITHN